MGLYLNSIKRLPANRICVWTYMVSYRRQNTPMLHVEILSLRADLVTLHGVNGPIRLL